MAKIQSGQTGSTALDSLQMAIGRSDIAFALGLMCILIVLIVPMAKWLLDFALACSLTISVLVLMTVLFIQRPLDFSSFPTVLLVTTMLRLSLNVASTRLILSHGHEGPSAAGHVIQAFGNFLMGGNFVIGIIVFSILVLVNFIVITKGSGRIAEVAARFSLDAMPGKQMAIDADLSAGLIDEKQAKSRRKELEGESNFFGSMDGAAKFVRGDAIAGLCITLINIIGGIIIGMAQNGLALSNALETYTLLTVGDGLITQIPALIVSTAAGMLVSKSGVEGSADKALFGQLSAYPRALGMSSFLMTIMAILPGVPALPFLMIAIASGYGAWKMTEKLARQLDEEEQQKNQEAMVSEETSDPTIQALDMDVIRLELGYGLLSLLNTEEGKKLTEQIKAIRKQLASEVGFVLPAVRIQDNLNLASNSYCVRIKEIEAARGDIRPHLLMVMDPQGRPIELQGEPTKEPSFGLDAKWISPNQRIEAERLNYTIVDASTVISTHLTELIKDYMSELLSFTETQKLLENMDDAHQKLLKDITPTQISTASIQRILQNLLTERVSIRDLALILESIAEVCSRTKDLSLITEHVRSRLARQICAANSGNDDILSIVTLSPDWEQAFAESIIGDGENRQLAMQPSKLQDFIGRVQELYNEMTMQGMMPVILVSPVLRPFIRSVIERFRPQTVVMSQNEIHPRVKIKTQAQIS